MTQFFFSFAAVLPIFLNRGREGVVLAVGAVTDIHEIPLIHCIVVHIKNVALFGWFADLTWVGMYHTLLLLRWDSCENKQGGF